MEDGLGRHLVVGLGCSAQAVSVRCPVSLSRHTSSNSLPAPVHTDRSTFCDPDSVGFFRRSGSRPESSGSTGGIQRRIESDCLFTLTGGAGPVQSKDIAAEVLPTTQGEMMEYRNVFVLPYISRTWRCVWMYISRILECVYTYIRCVFIFFCTNISKI